MFGELCDDVRNSQSSESVYKEGEFFVGVHFQTEVLGLLIRHEILTDEAAYRGVGAIVTHEESSQWARGGS